jgi:dihydroorotate dehydrogenase electron transfer subunit
MIQTLATVLYNTPLVGAYGRIGLACGEDFARARPGQFVMLGFPETLHPLIRRPFSIHRQLMAAGTIHGIELLYKMVGPATRRLSRLKQGDGVDLLGPLGSAFVLPAGAHRLYLAAGGVGVAPLLFFAAHLGRLQRQALECRLFLGGRSRDDLLCVEDFEQLGVAVVPTTDDGSCGDQCRVTTPLEDAIRLAPPDLVLACGPREMLACVQDITRRHGIACQLSIETMMACGVGACLGCAVAGRKDEARFLHACMDGPVFDADEVRL